MEKKKRKVIRNEGREMIRKVYHFLQREYEFSEKFKEPYSDLSHLRNITQRTAEATGVSVRTVQKVLQEERESMYKPLFTLPMKNIKRAHNKLDIDGYTTGMIRSKIQELYTNEQLPTLLGLHAELNKSDVLAINLDQLRKIARKIGYKWCKPNKHQVGHKKILVERHEVQICRLEYLKKVSEYRSQGKLIVYVDETVFRIHAPSNSGKGEKQTPFIKKTHTGFKIVHAGTEYGFIPNACLVYNANTGTEDYPVLSYESFLKWVDKKLMPNLPGGSVIVMNSSFQNHLRENIPLSSSSKSEMHQWLTRKGIEFELNMRKVELYNLIKKHKIKSYKVDEYIESKGFNVLRLPIHHLELNAINAIWVVLKNLTSLANVEKKLDIEQLINESIYKITSETWYNTCCTIIKREVEYLTYFDNEFDLEMLHYSDEEIDDGDESSSESS